MNQEQYSEYLRKLRSNPNTAFLAEGMPDNLSDLPKSKPATPQQIAFKERRLAEIARAGGGGELAQAKCPG